MNCTDEIKRNDFLNESIRIKHLSSGVKCYIIPKDNYAEKQAAAAFNYGSADFEFTVGGEKKRYPNGVAHFLEHKLFEDEKLNVFEQFTQNGADVNAFTNFSSTAYYFNCTDNFCANLRLLLDFVQKPYFTDENVGKEKGIITQEINMYRDDPFWRGYINLLESLYHKNPVRFDIAGSAGDIERITKDMLYENYNLFYKPRNMAVVCAGQLDAGEIYGTIEEIIKPSGAPEASINRFYADGSQGYFEPETVLQKEKTVALNLPCPLFNIGFKDNSCRYIQNGYDVIKRLAAGKALADIIAGEGSALYEKWYAQNLINDSFLLEYTGGTFFGYTLLSGFSPDPKRVNGMLLDECRRFAENGLPGGAFARIKKKHYGKLRKVFNSISGITHAQIDFFSKDADLFDLLRAYDELTEDDVYAKLKSHLNDGANALSIVE